MNIDWSRSQQGHVTTTLTLNCNTDGTIELETPPSHGGYANKFGSPEEAAQEFSKLLTEGIRQAR